MAESEPQVVMMERAARPLVPNAIHVVRTTQQVNVALSQMADQKASILMGATFLVFTIAVGQIRSGAMTVSLLILAFFAFISAVLAVFSILPKVTTARAVTEEDNVLFFGVFSSMSEKEFADRVVSHLDDDEKMYRLMLRDVYQNGCVLQRKKYRFLALAYRTFLIGLTLTFGTFVGEYIARYHWH